jgi:hypothetical protein
VPSLHVMHSVLIIHYSVKRITGWRRHRPWELFQETICRHLDTYLHHQCIPEFNFIWCNICVLFDFAGMKKKTGTSHKCFKLKVRLLGLSFKFWLLLYAHRHWSILGLLYWHQRTSWWLWGSKYGYCPILVLNQRPFNHWPKALTNYTDRAHWDCCMHNCASTINNFI